MKVALINGSPKPKKSMSRNILEAVLTQLEPNAKTVWIDTAVGQLPENVCPTLSSCDAIVLAFPLYVDGIPAHLLRVMKDIEIAVRTADGATCTADSDEGATRSEDTDESADQSLHTKPLMVYPIVNCGFMDEDYPEIAIDMVRIWCNKTGFAFGRAVGVSGGGMGPSLTIGKGPGTAIGKALTTLTEDIRSGGSGETILTKPTFPRFLYNMSGDWSWKKAARSRGLKKKDLYRQP